MKDFQNDFYYILERYGTRQYFIGNYIGKKNPSKTAQQIDGCGMLAVFPACVQCTGE